LEEFANSTTLNPLPGQSAELLLRKATGAMSRVPREKTSTPPLGAVVDIARSLIAQLAAGVDATGELGGTELAANAVP
jgi:hypothetical protein